MSNASFNLQWEEAMLELHEQVHQESLDPSIDPAAAPKSTDPHKYFQECGHLYVKYLQIFKKLEECYDFMVHPQKRIDIKAVLRPPPPSRASNLHSVVMLCAARYARHIGKFRRLAFRATFTSQPHSPASTSEEACGDGPGAGIDAEHLPVGGAVDDGEVVGAAIVGIVGVEPPVVAGERARGRRVVEKDPEVVFLEDDRVEPEGLSEDAVESDAKTSVDIDIA